MQEAISPGATRLLKAMAKGAGKTSTFTLPDMGTALAAIGWRLGGDVLVRAAHMSPDDYESFERRDPLYKELRAAGVHGMSGALSQTDTVTLYTEPGREPAISEVLHRQSREPRKIGEVQFGAVLGTERHGQYAIKTKPWLIGKPAIEVHNGDGGKTVVALKSEGPDVYSSPQMWTWGSKNGLKEAAEAVLSGDSVQFAQPKTLRTLDNTGTCPACFVNVKLTQGKIMRHGWTATGGGSYGAGAWHSGYCFGWRWPPFEVSPEGTKFALGQAKARQDMLLVQLEDPNLVVYSPRGRLIAPDSPNHAAALVARRSRIKKEIASTEESMDFYKKKISSWAPMNLARTASNMVGPYIRFNGKVWRLPLGTRRAVQPGGWTRVTLVDRNGKPLRTEVEITWSDRPGELQVFVSHRKSVTYKYEDLGDFAPEITDKDVRTVLREFSGEKTLAASLVRTHDDRALSLVGDVLEDVNVHDLSSRFPGSFEERGLVTAVSRQIDYDALAAIALAFYTATALKRVAPAEAAIEALKNVLRREAIESRH